MADHDDIADHYRRRRDERKDAETRVNREIESRRGWSELRGLDDALRRAGRDEEYRRWKDELDALHDRMMESRKDALEAVAGCPWAEEAYRAIEGIPLSGPDAPSELDAALAAVRSSGRSLLLFRALPSLEALRDRCRRYHEHLRPR